MTSEKPRARVLRAKDGSVVIVAEPGELEQSQPEPNGDPGPDFTVGEGMMQQFIDAVAGQVFDYNETPDGELRYYRCPHCAESTSTVVRNWHCEACGQAFNAADICDQVDEPAIAIPYDLAIKFAELFNSVVYGADPRAALKLKPGRKRTTPAQYWIQRQAAHRVHELMQQKSLNEAAEDVAEALASSMPKGRLDGRTVQNWYRKFFPQEK